MAPYEDVKFVYDSACPSIRSGRNKNVVIVNQSSSQPPTAAGPDLTQSTPRRPLPIPQISAITSPQVSSHYASHGPVYMYGTDQFTQGPRTAHGPCDSVHSGQAELHFQHNFPGHGCNFTGTNAIPAVRIHETSLSPSRGWPDAVQRLQLFSSTGDNTGGASSGGTRANHLGLVEFQGPRHSRPATISAISAEPAGSNSTRTQGRAREPRLCPLCHSEGKKPHLINNNFSTVLERHMEPFLYLCPHCRKKHRDQCNADNCCSVETDNSGREPRRRKARVPNPAFKQKCPLCSRPYVNWKDLVHHMKVDHWVPYNDDDIIATNPGITNPVVHVHNHPQDATDLSQMGSGIDINHFPIAAGVDAYPSASTGGPSNAAELAGHYSHASFDNFGRIALPGHRQGADIGVDTTALQQGAQMVPHMSQASGQNLLLDPILEDHTILDPAVLQALPPRYDTPTQAFPFRFSEYAAQAFRHDQNETDLQATVESVTREPPEIYMPRSQRPNASGHGESLGESSGSANPIQGAAFASSAAEEPTYMTVPSDADQRSLYSEDVTSSSNHPSHFDHAYVQGNADFDPWLYTYEQRSSMYQLTPSDDGNE